ncbi:MAG: heavy-metal-associated domain-containing protein [Nitrospirae bacterium]|nr:MAG: heavy-metal-associated domain-containing protein [Nitrospirota bacterium]
MITEHFPVQGMTCENCVRHVEKALRSVPGVASVTVDLTNHRATVEYDSAVVSRETLAAAVADAGYTLDVASS